MIKVLANAFFFLYLTSSIFLSGTTLVYSIKVRRISSSTLQNFLGQKKALLVTSLVPLGTRKDRKIVIPELGVNFKNKVVDYGTLLQLFYFKNDWWAEATTAIAKENAKGTGSLNFNISRKGFDDLVINFGHNKNFKNDMQLVLYGLAGFPIKRNLTLLENYGTLLGTCFYSLGFGAEFSYNLVKTKKFSLNFANQVRFIHFFNRKWTPVLTENDIIQPGNVTDLLIAMDLKLKDKSIELGYNPTFFTNQAIILSNGSSTIKSSNFFSDSIYANFSKFYYSSILKEYVNLGFGFSIGRSKKYDSKKRTLWASLSIIF